MSTLLQRVVVRSTFALAVGSASACASAPTSGPAWSGNDSATERVTLVVENLVWSDMVVYSSVSGNRTRLGTVVTGQTRRFRLPAYHAFATDLELVADPIGSRQEYVSGRIVASPGQEVKWILHRSAAARMLTVR